MFIGELELFIVRFWLRGDVGWKERGRRWRCGVVRRRDKGLIATLGKRLIGSIALAITLHDTTILGSCHYGG